MKKATLFFTGLIITNGLFAQDTKMQDENGTYFGQCTSFGISKSMRELSELYPIEERSDEPTIEAGDAESDRGPLPELNANALREADPARQTSNGASTINTPIINFDGTKDASAPCDPSGSAGPNHYVQAVNLLYRVYDKKGTALITAVKLSALWPNSGASKSDPIVLYDKFADRWLITILDVTNKLIRMAVSTTPDPTGTFYLYSFNPMPGVLIDYPKFSIWSDGYYQVGNTSPEKVVIYERAKMLKGDMAAGMIVATLTNMKRTSAFFCPVSLDADGQLPPYGAPNYVMSYEDNSWGTSYKDQINIFRVTANWSTKTATVSAEPSLPVQAFSGIVTATRNDIPQPGSPTTYLDAVDGLLMYRAPYRIWTNYNSVVLSHVVNAGNGVAGIRWYELRQDNTTKAWSIYQQSTYAPADGIARFMPSIAMDNYGNIALAYAASSTKVYAGLRYTGRLSTDPLGQMTFTEQVAVDGKTAQTSLQRFGDYSHTSMDPDGVTFWHTGEYLNSSGKATRIYSFQLASLTTNIINDEQHAELIVYQAEKKMIVRLSKLASNNNVVVDLFDISGKLIKGGSASPVLNNIETNIDITDLPKGLYFVRVGNNSFQKVVKIIVN